MLSAPVEYSGSVLSQSKHMWCQAETTHRHGSCVWFGHGHAVSPLMITLKCRNGSAHLRACVIDLSENMVLESNRSHDAEDQDRGKHQRTSIAPLYLAVLRSLVFSLAHRAEVRKNTTTATTSRKARFNIRMWTCSKAGPASFPYD